MGPPPPPSTHPEVSDKGTLSHPFYLLLWWKVLDVTSNMPFKTRNYVAFLSRIPLLSPISNLWMTICYLVILQSKKPVSWNQFYLTFRMPLAPTFTNQNLKSSSFTHLPSFNPPSQNFGLLDFISTLQIPRSSNDSLCLKALILENSPRKTGSPYLFMDLQSSQYGKSPSSNQGSATIYAAPPLHSPSSTQMGS